MLQQTQTTKHTRKVFVPVKLKWKQKETNQILSDFKKAVKETKTTRKEIELICNITIRRKRTDLFMDCKYLVHLMYQYKHIYESKKLNPNIVYVIGHVNLQQLIRTIDIDLKIMFFRLSYIKMKLGII